MFFFIFILLFLITSSYFSPRCWTIGNVKRKASRYLLAQYLLTHEMVKFILLKCIVLVYKTNKNINFGPMNSHKIVIFICLFNNLFTLGEDCYKLTCKVDEKLKLIETNFREIQKIILSHKTQCWIPKTKPSIIKIIEIQIPRFIFIKWWLK